MPATHRIESELIEHIYQSSIICIFDENFSVLYANTNFTQLIGYSNNHITGTSLQSLKHKDQSDNIYHFIINTLKNNKIWKGEILLRHLDSKAISVDTTIKPVISDNKNRYIATFININPQKKLINNLKQRAHRQGLIAILGQLSLNNIPINDLIEQTLSVICGSLNIKTGLMMELSVDANDALVRASYNNDPLTPGQVIIGINENNMLGYTLNSEQPVACQDFNDEDRFSIPDEFKASHFNSAICLVIGEKKQPFGMLVLLSDNHRNINLDETYFLQSICNILAEAINRKNIELALRQEKELSKNYLDVANIVFLVLDTKQNILMANRHASSVLGYSQDELAGVNFFNLCCPNDILDSSKNTFDKIISMHTLSEADKNSLCNIMPIINKNKNTRQIKWRISTLLDEKKCVSAILYTGEDISESLIQEEEQRRLERKLHQAKKVEAIGMLAGGIAHDFNNILVSILGFSELAFEALEDKDSKLYDYITQIQKSGNKAKDIIEQLQNINLQDETSTNEILLPSLLNGTLKMLRSALPASIDMQVSIDNNTPAVHINASKFNQVVMHLLTNSRNAINGKGKIQLNLCVETISQCQCSSCHETIDGSYVVLAIHDNGPGISASIINNSFAPTNIKPHSHSHTGLPFINNTAHETNGHILITDSHLGHTNNTPGTCIKLLFKIADDISKDIQNKKNTHDLSNLANKHIMIVDDENSVATYLGELFKNAGFKSSIFCDSVEALSTFKENPSLFDLVVSDQIMPVINGDDLALKMLNIRSDIPIIICSGDTKMFNSVTAEDLKIKYLLKKPVNSAELLHSVVNSLTMQY